MHKYILGKRVPNAIAGGSFMYCQ